MTTANVVDVIAVRGPVKNARCGREPRVLRWA